MQINEAKIRVKVAITQTLKDLEVGESVTIAEWDARYASLRQLAIRLSKQMDRKYFVSVRGLQCATKITRLE